MKGIEGAQHAHSEQQRHRDEHRIKDMKRVAEENARDITTQSQYNHFANVEKIKSKINYKLLYLLLGTIVLIGVIIYIFK